MVDPITGPELIDQLVHQYRLFADTIAGLDEAAFCRSKAGKWTPGQQLDHMVRSVAPLAMAVGIPRTVLRLRFGTADRPSRTYDVLVARYHELLEAGGRATGAFVPPAIAWADRTRLLEQLDTEVNRLVHRIESWPEDRLDTVVLPHPLLGRLTLREMLYFTLYHVQHHHRQVLDRLEG